VSHCAAALLCSAVCLDQVLKRDTFARDAQSVFGTRVRMTEENIQGCIASVFRGGVGRCGQSGPRP